MITTLLTFLIGVGTGFFSQVINVDRDAVTVTSSSMLGGLGAIAGYLFARPLIPLDIGAPSWFIASIGGSLLCFIFIRSIRPTDNFGARSILD